MKMPTALCHGRVVVELLSSPTRDEAKLLFPSGAIYYVLRDTKEAWPAFVKRVTEFAERTSGW